ncbi:MAG: NrfD/PsrC family molybdoenzyme membrane anchor subunit [Pseudomonadota bacterium]|nr:NrfD/PsrC family molybdoenzyme membrane anchor subunit [Pseudomonadota bacterium]
MSNPSSEPPPVEIPGAHPIRTYPQFLWKAVGVATDGNFAFYAWMTALTAVFLVGVHAFARQTAHGLALTALSDHVSWGMYIGNFTFAVGLAAGAVMMVIPAYLYRDHDMHDVVIVGEILAISAIVVSLAFVNVDLGRLDRAWHLMPVIGRFNWPMSMLTWDVVVLSGYLAINLHVVGYLLYTRFRGATPNPKWYVPFVFLSIVWAVSIHTVTAFLYSGLGGRPFWNTAILAPRFIASAFVTGPAFIVLALQVVRRLTDFHVGDKPIATLVSVLRVTVLLNLFLVGAEVFTELYAGTAHSASARYLYFGLHGHNALVPWIWSAIALNVTAAALFLSSSTRTHLWRIDLACVLTMAGVWIEKGIGLIVPGFVPSTLHELVEYLPNALEWKVTLGIWALGLLVFTVGLKLAVAVFTGRMRADTAAQGSR